MHEHAGWQTRCSTRALLGGAMKGKSMTLIDGGKLIDLLIDHGIRVKKNKIEVLSVVVDAFADLEPEA